MLYFLWAGEQADLIFVFFDPMGQALCKRTLNIVEKLSQKCADKLLFYLSKADEAGKETDRQVSLPDLYNLFLFQRKLNMWDELFFFSSESDDADSPRTVPPSRS